MPVRAVRTARQLVSGAIAQQRFQSSLAAGFAALALVLAALGVFGVVSSGAARRRREAGLRMALGASSRAVLRLILSQGMRPVLIGLATGLAGAALLGRAMQSLLFGVSAFDARAYAAAAGTVALASLIACYMPARRAASLAPMDALRQD
ncbi:MAG: hypothetical protein H6509_01895 [Bryobacterales bacterium]|nr:hypothetical protein [Bryobacterales bacterium]